MLRIFLTLFVAVVVCPTLATTLQAEEKPGRKIEQEVKEIDAALARFKKLADEAGKKGNKEELHEIKEKFTTLVQERSKLLRTAEEGEGNEFRRWVEQSERKSHELRKAGKIQEAEALLQMVVQKVHARRRQQNQREHEHQADHDHEHGHHDHEHADGHDGEGHDHGDHEHAHHEHAPHEHAHHEHAPHGPANHREIMERVHHMKVAAENLTAAGLKAEADHLRKKAEQMQRSLQHPGGELHAELQELRQHVHRLTRQVEELTEMVRELRRDK